MSVLPPVLTQSQALSGLECKRRAWGLTRTTGSASSMQRELRVESRRRLIDAALHLHAPHADRNVEASNGLVSVTADAVEAGRTLFAVRSGASIKTHHIDLLAIQWWTLRTAGFDIDTCLVLHVNPQHRAPGPEPLFVKHDVTRAVRTAAAELASEVQALQSIVTGGRPEPEPGSHCNRPFVCPYFDDCHTGASTDPLSDLYRVKERLLRRLRSTGVTRIQDIPEDFPLPAVAKRQRNAIQAGHAVVDSRLSDALDRVEAPVAFIDFEAIQPAIPAWEGCRPFEAIPVQVSIHLVDCDGTVEHHEWIVSGPEDPRTELARLVAPVVSRATTLVAYYAQFENSMLKALAAHADGTNRDALIAANERFVDLLPMIRDHVYHPEFRGRFNLKTVVSALLPDLAYDDLAVNRGDIAGLLLEEYILHGQPTDAPARAALLDDLLAYCRRDTLTLLRLVELLRRMAAEPTH